MGKKYAIWNAVINGFKSNFNDLNKFEKETNARSISILLATIDSMTDNHISSYKRAKEM